MTAAAVPNWDHAGDPLHDPSRVAVAVLAGLEEMEPAHLRHLLRHWPNPRKALHSVASGRAAEALPPPRGARVDRRPHLATLWASSVDIPRTERILAERHTRVLVAGEAHFPIDDDPGDGPRALLVEGSKPEAFDAPRVAIVGTRAATPHGIADAKELGAALAHAGVTVVSGLAIGIDAAGHEGALHAGGRVVGVIATGLDVVYPRRHTALYGRVRDAGVVVSEYGFGARPIPHRFPIRNRVIAAIADVTVLVEATARGGARITADAALRYGRPVFVMPGSRRNPAAAGCNALLSDGAQPLLEPDDVILALGMTPGIRRKVVRPPRAAVSIDAHRLLAALGGEPASPDQLVSRTGLSAATVAAAVGELLRADRAKRQGGLLWPT